MRETARRISAAFENEPFRFLCAWVEPIVNCLSVISFENCMERLAYDFCGNVLFFSQFIACFQIVFLSKAIHTELVTAMQLHTIGLIHFIYDEWLNLKQHFRTARLFD